MKTTATNKGASRSTASVARVSKTSQSLAQTMNEPQSPIWDKVRSALEWLKTHGTKATLDGMARYAIPSDKAYGVAMKDIKTLGKQLGRHHEFASALWDTGVYEARLLASFVGDPARLTAAQMDRWCREFDNWAVCDTLCFNLFDRSPHAWAKVTQWSRKRRPGLMATPKSLALKGQRIIDTFPVPLSGHKLLAPTYPGRRLLRALALG